MVFPLLPSILPSALFNFPIAEFFVSSAFAESFVVTPLSRAVILSLTPPTVWLSWEFCSLEPPTETACVSTFSDDWELMVMLPFTALRLPFPVRDASTSWITTDAAKNPPYLLERLPLPVGVLLPLFGFTALPEVSGVLFVDFVVTVELPFASRPIFPFPEMILPRTWTWESFTTTDKASDIGSAPTVERVVSVTSLIEESFTSPPAVMTESLPVSTLASDTRIPAASGM